MLYNAVSVSAAQQGESAMCVRISPLPWISFPFRSSQSTEWSFLCFDIGSHILLYFKSWFLHHKAPIKRVIKKKKKTQIIANARITHLAAKKP